MHQSEQRARKVANEWLSKAALKKPGHGYHCELWTPQFDLETYFKGHRRKADQFRLLEDVIYLLPQEKDWFCRIGVQFLEVELGRVGEGF